MNFIFSVQVCKNAPLLLYNSHEFLCWDFILLGEQIPNGSQLVWGSFHFLGLCLVSEKLVQLHGQPMLCGSWVQPTVQHSWLLAGALFRVLVLGSVPPRLCPESQAAGSLPETSPGPVLHWALVNIPGDNFPKGNKSLLKNYIRALKERKKTLWWEREHISDGDKPVSFLWGGGIWAKI